MHYIMSDIHNDCERFREMLQRISFSKEDHLFIVGDVFDRSNHNPNPVDLYFKILSLDARCTMIRGNHDHWLATYILDYYALPERKRKKLAPYPYNSFSLLQERLTPIDMQNLAHDILAWPLQKMVEIAGNKYLLGHAMTSMPTNLESENHYLLGLSDNTSYLLSGIDGYISIIGHTNTANGRIWKNAKKNVCIIDCGCGFRNGKLGCLCLETKEEFYV